MQPASHARILDVLRGLGERIFHLERAHGVTVGGSDLRPRIERFQDAVRAITRGDTSANNPRLRLETLAEDAETLRALAEGTLPVLPEGAAMPTHGPLLASGTTLPVLTGAEDAALPPTTDLRSLYRHYAVLFVALIGGMADRNYQDRKNSLDALVVRLAQLARNVAAGTLEPDALEAALAELPAAIQKTVRARLPQGAAPALRQGMHMSDSALSKLEATHTHFLSQKMGLYLGAKDVVNALALAGANIAGSFVDANARRSSGGRPRTRG